MYWILCAILLVVGGESKGWDLVSGLRYRLTTTLLFREVETAATSGDVGFRLTGELHVTSVWNDPTDSDNWLLRLELKWPQLWIKSRRAPEPEGFVEHSSNLDDAVEKPVLVLWRNGEVRTIYLDPTEPVSSANLKRGLASLLQYRLLDDEVQERDASGLCNVTYHSTAPETIVKQKTFCEHSSLPTERRHHDPILRVKLSSVRTTTYELADSLLPKGMKEVEEHKMSLAGKSGVGTTVISLRTLELIPGALEANRVTAATVEDAVVLRQPGYKESSVELQQEVHACPGTGCPTLEKTIEENRKALENAAMGTGRSASAFLKLVPLVKSASPEELVKILKSPRYRHAKTQLLDVFGSTSTPAAHQAAMKVLRQDDVGDDTERYLWALSLSSSPHVDVIKDILRRSEETIQNDKVSETMALTAAAMARHEGSPTVIETTRVSLELGLESCTGEECKIKFLRALRNLGSKAAIPTLLKYATDENKAISVVAWRALAALPREYITREVRSAAVRVFYQIGGPKRDSSARTLALNVLLENDPTVEELRDLIEYLSGNDSAYEIRKYLSQRLEQISLKDGKFAENLREVLETMGRRVNNYNVMSLKGLSTAFTRSFLKSEESNGSLVTIQEVNSGLLKRGIVDVVLDVDQHRQAMFSLGLFAGGLGSFVSSSGDEENPEVEDEPATAGMEIDFLGVGVRPFVFFSGQGELMGHVWSGTASERTPAFQAISALHSYTKHVPLASGFVAELEVQGAVSFDLSGQIQLSLWSRNAQSLVDMKAGVVIQGGTKVRSSLVQSNAEFLMTVEPRLELATDVDFSGPVSLCMRLSQPSTVVRYQVYKVERIAGSRHRLRKTRRSRQYSPARSYLLNRKNNEMCSKVFS
ncbi:hypothetical protein KM043_008607 [Ampulex compressa]|nr:hypothetical protein KM043_008607 [Ampulex compressa]